MKPLSHWLYPMLPSAELMHTIRQVQMKRISSGNAGDRQGATDWWSKYPITTFTHVQLVPRRWTSPGTGMEFGVKRFWDLSDMTFLLEFPDEQQPEKYFSFMRQPLNRPETDAVETMTTQGHCQGLPRGHTWRDRYQGLRSWAQTVDNH